MHTEQWTAIREAPGYEVSSLGRVRRGDFDVATWPNHKGYIMVSLEIAGVPRLRYVHRLVLTAFRGVHPHPKYRLVNHENEQKSENRLENLAWTTPWGNVRHARQRRAELVYGQQSLLELLC